MLHKDTADERGAGIRLSLADRSEVKMKKAEIKPKAKPKTKPRKRKSRVPPAIAQIVARAAIPAAMPEPQPEPIETAGDDGLTNKQRVFIDQYLICWNSTEAARRAGYSSPEQSGYENRNKPLVKAAIDARLKEHKLSADEVLARLSEQASSSMADFLSVYDNPLTNREESTIDLEKARAAGKLHLIKKVNIGKDGISIELYDARGALELLGKHYELFTEKHKHEGEVGTRITNLNDLLKLAYGPKPETKPG